MVLREHASSEGNAMSRLYVFGVLVGFLVAMAAVGLGNAADESGAKAYPFVFRDVGDETGLFPHVAGIRGHAAAWGDIDGSGYPSLFVGTFADAGSKTSLLLRNNKGKFSLDEQEHVRLSSCASGAIFVDLDNRGKLDLYVGNNAHGKDGLRATPNALFRNDGGGKFTDVSKDSGACPPGLQARTVAALDFDGDGLLDLIVTDFYYTIKATYGIALFRNKGNYRFEDVTKAAGLPVGSAVSGVAVADVNNDGWPDLFLTSPDGNNRLFLNDGKGHFREAPMTREVFAWKNAGGDDAPTGVCIADLNRDGLPDIVVGHHFKAPWRSPAPIRLYLNRGIKDGNPVFEDVTEAAGLKPLAMKAPHLEIQDFDNDGWPDIYVSIVKFAGGKPYPVIYRNHGIQGGIPRFREDAWAVNDFPTADDRSPKGGTAAFFKKVLTEKKIIYMAAGPTADFDRDGRLDIFLANWWIESRSLLLRNETPGGNWLQVQVEGGQGVNRMGIGSKVKVYPAGKLGDASALLGCREIAVGYGWCSGQEAVAHFGLGKEEMVDLEIILPHGKGQIVRKGVKCNQRVTVKQ
jgi:hypothetical protein